MVSLAKGFYIRLIAVYWQIKLFRFFDQVPIFFKKYMPEGNCLLLI